MVTPATTARGRIPEVGHQSLKAHDFRAESQAIEIDGWSEAQHHLLPSLVFSPTVAVIFLEPCPGAEPDDRFGRP
jgi:hypothetical protein